MFPSAVEQVFAPICPSASPAMVRQMAQEERSRERRRRELAETHRGAALLHCLDFRFPSGLGG